MPAITPSTYKGNAMLFSGSDKEPKAVIPQFLYQTYGYGIPRYEDLITIRMLEETHTVALPLKTILQQVTTTPFVIRPTVDNPTPDHEGACEDIFYFLDGHFNTNKESFDHLMKMVIRDILSIDAGIIEKVPVNVEGKQYLGELYARNGATFTKNLDKYGRYYEPPEPAYYQFSMPSVYAPYNRDTTMRDLAELSHQVTTAMQYGKMGAIAPIPFTTDQIAWMEENPRTWNIYGQGRVQEVKRLVEIILNQDISNRKYFQHNEIPDGIMNIITANQSSIDRMREYWRNEIQGKPHKLPIVGGEVNYTPFRPSPRELDFISSQQWFNKLVWMVFGLNQNEVGDLADVNRATAKEQSATIYRRTTMPLLSFIEQMFNTEILPYMKEYHDINGEVEFAFIPYNYEAESLQREQQIIDLNHNIATVNEIRIERGLDTFTWGDLPMSLLQQFIRSHPEWFYEHFVYESGLPEPPEPMPEIPFMSYKDNHEGDDNFFYQRLKDPSETKEGESSHP